jgi:transketolase
MIVEEISKLISLQKEIKLKTLELYKRANAGHIGSSLSCLDLMVYLFFRKIRENDRFILSKGHAACALYCVLNFKGLVSDSELDTFYREGTFFSAHPPAKGIKGIPFATGSLGHGASLAAGLALSAKLNRTGQQVYCLVSDGECNEGSVWEAAAFCAHNRLDNLTVIIDKNNIQGFGFTKDVLNMENMAERWQAFGWQTVECDGHDFSSIEDAINRLDEEKTGKPSCIVAHTVKGKGISYMENTIASHYWPMNDEQYKIACEELITAF